jgi:hypothetical protein
MCRPITRVVGLCLAGLFGLALTHAAGPSDEAKLGIPKKTEATCGAHGTRVEFVDTPNEAAKIAKKEQKLVFVLHVSGNFEDPRFT